METVGSFNDMVVLSLQYQGFPTQQPVQQHTEGPTYEVGDEPCSTHSERQRHLPTFQLMAGERPFLFLLSFFFYKRHFFLLGLWSPSLSCDGKSCVSGNHSESAERCMPASRHNTLSYFFSMLNQPTGMLWDMCVLHELMGNLALYFGVIAHGCVDGGMGGPLCIL